MLIIRGHRGLAEAYACRVLDLYDHYAWRFLLKAHPEIFGKPLAGDDSWQDRYIKGAEEKSAELRFWLSAAGNVAGAMASSASDAADNAAPADAIKRARRRPTGPGQPGKGEDGQDGKQKGLEARHQKAGQAGREKGWQQNCG
jgi:hypothetical protein